MKPGNRLYPLWPLLQESEIASSPYLASPIRQELRQGMGATPGMTQTSQEVSGLMIWRIWGAQGDVRGVRGFGLWVAHQPGEKCPWVLLQSLFNQFLQFADARGLLFWSWSQEGQGAGAFGS